MKVVASKNDTGTAKREALLPLVPIPSEEMNSSNSVSYLLRVKPSDNDSPTYKKYVRVLSGSEDVRTVIQWSRDQAACITGLNLTDVGDQYTLTLNLLQGSAKTVYDTCITDRCEDTRRVQVAAAADNAARAAVRAATTISFLMADDLMEAKKTLLTSLIPKKIVAMVKRYLRRECRKPPGMSVRVYYQHLLRINNDELVLLPPFQADQNMGNDELIDILIYATPRSWSREMERQGFDPITSTLPQVVDFMERIEQAEDFDGQKVDHGQKTSTNSNKKKKSSDGGSKTCLIHGAGTHSSNECKVLQALAKDSKKDGNPSGGNKGKGKFGNKTWSRKANEAKEESKKDLAAFIKKAVAKGVQKELNNTEKKKKRKASFDMNAFDGELKDFNYEDMENLKIDSDDESSVSV